ncbi:glucosamine-6-phosphate deaminase [Mesonia ostreae]|uniref:Glucosamine-6-phosphate deaminase n=1 Tax=Mesonia ostreae TaxID=861110 RepID=A0ABU2KH63_9FLAO|nr:glucosamine-6-phosphate deaminase [Mesonia ostreae]MDT0294029.1 glucosamine-6-phosphate deaminase [Mesonia ostreae]
MSKDLHTANRAKKLNLFATPEHASLYVAKQIAELIREQQKQSKPTVLGLATGNTPKRVYKELIRLHKEESLSFKNVISFNLDEYYPIYPEDEQSYTHFMRENLFDHIDIEPQNIYIPYTDCSLDGIAKYCKDYESKIAKYGGLDFQLLGIGRNGHIGFNEPGSSFDSVTRLVNLHELTREDAASDFGTIDNVPNHAISIGIQTITQAKKIVLLALGERKSEVMRKSLQGKITTQVPASILQTLPQVEYVLDHEAAALSQE